ncbi:MAG: hypothetical protein ACLVFS_04220 [Butyricicoccus sp.]
MSENRPQMTVQSAVEVVAAVVDVEQSEKVLRIYREEQAPVDFVCMAHGTARTEMLDLLGIGETAKAIVMCMVSRQTGVRLLKRLGRELEMRYPGRGIAFAIPITGIGLRWHKLLTAADEEQKEVSRMHETEKNDGFDGSSCDGARLYQRGDGCGAQGRRTRWHGHFSARYCGK